MKRFDTKSDIKITAYIDRDLVFHCFAPLGSFASCKAHVRNQLVNRFDKGTLIQVSAYQKSTDVYHSAKIKI